MKTHSQSNNSNTLSQETKQLDKLGRLRKHFKAQIRISRSHGNYDFARYYKKELFKIDTERWDLSRQLEGLI